MKLHRPNVRWFLSLALLVGAAGCAPPAPTREFVQQAARLHDGALAPAVARDADLREYIQAVGQRLSDGAHAAAPAKTRAAFFSDLRTHLVASDVPNVFATGGAHVYVYNGLLQRCAGEEELAAAMAHAFAHAVNLDVEETRMRPAPNRPLRLVVHDFATSRFTLEQEREAHELAFQIYVRAGYNPDRFENVFQVLGDAYPTPTAPDRVPLATRGSLARAMAGKADQKWRKPTVADRTTFNALKKQAAAMSATTVAGDAPLLFRALPNCVLGGDLPEQAAAQASLRPVLPRRVEIEPN